jgi:hypothetical protein
VSRPAEMSTDKAPREHLHTRDWHQLADEDATAEWVQAAVFAAGADVVADGTCLGPVKIAGGVVVPFATFDEEVLETRVKLGLEPAVDRLTLRRRLEDGGLPARAPIRDLALVGLLGHTSYTTMARVSGYGTPVLLAYRRHQPDALTVAECDWRDLGLALVDELHATRWLIRPTRGPSSSVTDLRQEQLLEVAWRSHQPRASRPRRLAR